MSSIRRILVAVDFRPPADAALILALDLARAVAAEVDVVHVVDNLALALVELPQYADLRGLQRELEQSAQQKIGRLVIDQRRSTLQVRAVVVVTASAPATAIVDHARRVHADLIVMGTHGRNALGRLILGSVADQVIRTAPCPVLTARSSDFPETAADASTAAARGALGVMS